MKTALYPRLAWDGLRKNKRLFLPYLLTCVCMVMMFYILSFLGSPETCALLPRGSNGAGLILNLGSAVIFVFSAIFLYYTNSFLIRRRTQEFGLYNVLGMGKRNLARIATWESLITAALSLAFGLALGIIFSKLAELGLLNMLGGEINYRVRIDAESVTRTLGLYAVIFALIWLSTVIRVGRSSAVALLRSESVGEKPPKANWALGMAGLVILAAAYYLAVSITNPIDAMVWFFVAVILVIVATYLLLIAGSVLLCRVLQKNKQYYYQPSHFVSVSSMAYRMKRNGAGLASVCIIATMILVMISSSSCLYFGSEDAIMTRYPRETNITLNAQNPAQLEDANLDIFRKGIADFAAERGVPVENVLDYRFINVSGLLDGDTAQCYYRRAGASVSYADIRDFYILSAADYAAKTGDAVSLAYDEALVLTNKCSYEHETLTLSMEEVSHTWRVKTVQTGSVVPPNVGGLVAQITLVVNDPVSAVEGFRTRDEDDMTLLRFEWIYGFDTGLDDEASIEFEFDLTSAIGRLLPEDLENGRFGYSHLMTSSRGGASEDFYGSNGALFFIGIMLTLVFMLAAVLILYYKQISEGYEDQKRFEIMQKVGMTKKEIRRSINSQLLTVFFLPLLLAGVHLAFAFPMIRRLLELFSLYNVGLFVTTTLVSFGAFALLYTIVYRLTAKAYYNIVSA